MSNFYPISSPKKKLTSVSQLKSQRTSFTRDQTMKVKKKISEKSLVKKEPPNLPKFQPTQSPTLNKWT